MVVVNGEGAADDRQSSGSVEVLVVVGEGISTIRCQLDRDRIADAAVVVGVFNRLDQRLHVTIRNHDGTAGEHQRGGEPEKKYDGQDR